MIKFQENGRREGWKYEVTDRPYFIRPFWLSPEVQKGYWINERWIRWKVMTTFTTLRPKTYGYLTDDSDESKKGKDTKNLTPSYIDSPERLKNIKARTNLSMMMTKAVT